MKKARALVKTLLILGVVAVLAGCQNAEIDKLRGANLKMREQLDQSLSDVDKTLAERNAALAQADQLRRDKEVVQRETDLWKEKYQVMADAQQTQKAIPAELEKIIRDILGGVPGATYREGVIMFPGDVVFDAGKATIKPKAKEAIQKIAAAFNEKGEGFILGIDGHTDEQPIKKSAWDDNWQLGAERARAVLKLLASEGVAQERMYMTSHGPFSPVDPGHGESAWKKNRRVEVVLIPAGARLSPAGPVLSE